MTSATNSTTASVIRVHSSLGRHSYPPRNPTSPRDPVKEVAKDLALFIDSTAVTLEKMMDHQKHVVKVLEEIDERLRILLERVRRLEDLVGGNLVREGYN